MFKNYILYFLVFVVSLLLFFDENYAKLFNSLTTSTPSLYRGTSDINSKTELALIFITSSTCVFSNNEKLPYIIEDFKIAVKKKALDLEYNFTAIGISTDLDTQEGLDHLNKFGFFDEIIIGNGWSNIGAYRYVYDDIKGLAITPQILITKKEFDLIGLENTHRVGVREEIQILRKVGLDQILEWNKLGTPLASNLRSL